MNLISIKKETELRLNGVTISAERQDGTIRQLTFDDGCGNVIVIRPTSYDNIKVLVPEPVKLVKKHRLHGTVLGLAVDQLFDEAHEASDQSREYRACVTRDSDVNLTVDVVEVPEVG